MPIVKEFYNNEYIGIYEKYNYRIIGKLATYHSIMTNEDYEVITDIKIIDTNTKTIIYEASNLQMAYDKEGLISIVNYAEKITLYLHTETCDIYWKQLFLDKFFKNCETLKLELYYKRVTKELQEQQRIKETEQIRNNIEFIKQQIQNKYNNIDIAVFYNLFDIYIINESRLIERQNNNNYIDNIEENPNIYKPYILKHIKLNWIESDISLLNSLLLEA